MQPFFASACRLLAGWVLEVIMFDISRLCGGCPTGLCSRLMCIPGLERLRLDGEIGAPRFLRGRADIFSRFITAISICVASTRSRRPILPQNEF